MPQLNHQPPREDAAQADLLAVAFRVARKHYALPLDAVLQVVRLPSLTLLPDAPPGYCGLLNLRGRFIPVLDARTLLGEAPVATLESQLMILTIGRTGEPRCGLLVDAVDDVRHYAASSFAGLTTASPIVAGVLAAGDAPVIVLDATGLVAGPDSHSMRPVPHSGDGSPIATHDNPALA